jgi:hypothetical protein
MAQTVLVLGIAAAVPVGAVAAHGKAGLWEITTRMNMPNMMANIPPDQLARMQAMGVHMPNGQTMTTQHCMTAEEAAMDKPPPIRSAQGCAVSNSTHDAHTYTADMVCSGEMDGHGHVSVTYDSDEHYSGNYSFSGSAHGHPANMTTSFEGRWISADCGAAK